MSKRRASVRILAQSVKFQPVCARELLNMYVETSAITKTFLLAEWDLYYIWNYW